MGLKFYDDTQTLFGAEPLRTTHDGQVGGSDEVLVYVRNDDAGLYFTNLSVAAEVNLYNDWGEFGDTGWGIKLLYGERRPTEAEWDLVRSGDSIVLPDIGDTSAADTSTYYPVWVRVYCPGGEPAQIRDNLRLRLGYYARVVGS